MDKLNTWEITDKIYIDSRKALVYFCLHDMGVHELTK